MSVSRFAFLLCAALLASAGLARSAPSDAGTTSQSVFIDRSSYFNQPQSFYYFHHMDELGFKQDWVRRGKGPVYPLAEATAPFTIDYSYRGKTYTLEQYFQRNATLGFLVLHDDRIVLERYFHGSNAASHFLSNSIAKSFTSTLVGAAVDDGKIAGVDDKIVKYLPYLQASSGYRNTTIREILEMATGLDFDEDYLNPKAQVRELMNGLLQGTPSFKDVAISIRHKYPANTKFEYQSINTEVLGLLVEKVTGEPLNQYFSEKIWQKVGAQSDGFLYRSKSQPDQCAFGCFNATLRDYGRFGLAMMRGGALAGNRIVSEAWVREATTPGAKFLEPLPPGPHDAAYQGYAYQWWIPYGRDGAFEGLGVYGQVLYVNPARHVVIVQTSAWKLPDPDPGWDESQRVMDTIASRL